MTNLLDNWEEVLAQEVKAMKKRPLPRKTARLKTFISSLLQAQRKKDAETLIPRIEKLLGFGIFNPDQTVGDFVERQVVISVIKETFNQSNNNEESH